MGRHWSDQRRRSAMSPTQPRFGKEMVVALLLLALGALLRFGGLGLHGLWLDEATTLQFVSHDARGCLHAEVNNPPLHRMLLWGWVRLVGPESDALVRLPDAILGLLACLVSWRLAMRVLPPKAALIALGLLALNPYQVLLSQEVRPYSLLLLLSSLGFLLHLRTLVGDRRIASSVALLLVLVAGLHSHYQFAWVALAVGLHRLWFLARSWRAGAKGLGAPRVGSEALRLLWPLAGAVLLFSPWLWTALSGLSSQHRGYTTDLLGRVVSLPFMLLLGESGVVRQYPETHGQAALGQLWIVMPFALCIAPLLVLGTRSLWRFGGEARFLLMAAVGPVVGLSLLFHWLPLFTARYLSFLSPVLCVLLAASVTAHGERRAGRWTGRLTGLAPRAALVVLFTLQVVSLGRYHLDPRFGREDWRGAASWVKARERQGDLLLFDHGYVQIPFDRYHHGPASRWGVPGDAPRRRALFAELRAAPPARVFLLLSHNWDRGRETFDVLSEVMCLQESRIFRRSNGIEAHLFERCPGRAR